MNKKLKIYCTLFWLAITIWMVNSVKFDRGIVIEAHYDRETSVSADNPAHADGWEYGNTPARYYYESDTVYDDNGGFSKYKKSSTYYYDVYVTPKKSADKRTLISRVGGNIYKVALQKVRVIVPADEVNKTFFIFRIVLFLLATGMTIWVIYLLLMLIGKIRKGEIFVSEVSRMMETTGILLSCLFLLRWIIMFSMAHYCINNIELANYDILDKVDANGMLILTGLGLMIISQIILMGKDLKEEQDLTI